MNATTEALLASRKATYGDRVQNMVDIAGIWSILLGHTIQPWQVPLMMDAVKQHRQFKSPDYGDTADDRDGWFKIFREVMGDDMIEARTVEEYEAEKARRERVGQAVEELAQLARITMSDAQFLKYVALKPGEGGLKPGQVVTTQTDAHTMSLDPTQFAAWRKILEGSGNPYANVPDFNPNEKVTANQRVADGQV